MSITAERKQELISEYATNKGDTGSPEVQVATCTSGEPVSPLFVAYSDMSSCFRSAVIDIIYSNLIKSLKHALDESHHLQILLAQPPYHPPWHKALSSVLCAMVDGKVVALAKFEGGEIRPVRVLNF